MATIQWRPAVNALTTPNSYRMLFLPRNVVDTQELAVRMAAELPNYSADELRAILAARNKVVRQSLINGEQVTEENNFTYSLSFTARLESADDAPPPLDQCLQVRVHASPPFVAEVRHAAQLERLSRDKKLPLINTAEDTLLKLDNVLNPDGVLRLTGEDLFFDVEQGTGDCVISGTQSGRAVQSRVNLISNSTIMLMPEIPAQSQPWNNEYTISVTTRYTAHGIPRTGIYERMLRAPLTLSNFNLPHPPETGILTGSADSAYVSVTGGAVSADTRLRIQVILDSQGERLLFSLLDMKEGGAAGSEVSVTQNGEYTLPGFSGSALSSLAIRVNNYAALWAMVRSGYGGRLVDVLDLRM
uniref:hypothetical protein n=1 Tax=Candidatus Electronema sp. TaxID=2698783 RepID=UPI0040561B8C